MLLSRKMRARRAFCVSVFVLMLISSSGYESVAQDRAPRRFILNENTLRDLDTAPDPGACNPKSVLLDLLRQIGPVARIYPTENYYYFDFRRGGKSYAATLRLAVDRRDQSFVQFTCMETLTSWIETNANEPIETELSQADGVRVTKNGPLEYSVAIDDAETKFILNDLDQTPDPQKLGSGEHFAGRIFDESGLIFELIYNKPAKAFYFLLDTRNQVPEAFINLKHNVHVGVRTGFVFFEDVALKRFLLVAVHAEEVFKNTAYDGPFDQLPENFYEKLGFWKFVYEAYPHLVGKLTPGGTYIGEKFIFGIFPYRTYTTQEDLRFIDACTKSRKRAKILLCLTKGAD